MQTEVSDVPLSSLTGLSGTPQLSVIRRSGEVVPFNEDKITTAIKKAFVDVEGLGNNESARIHKSALDITAEVVKALKRFVKNNHPLHIEDIQDQVELALMRREHYKVARSYVVYREQRKKVREAQHSVAVTPEVTVQVKLADGSIQPLDLSQIRQEVVFACEGLEHVDPELIIKETIRNLYDGVTLQDVRRMLIITARPLIEIEPNYAYVSARLLLNICYDETLGLLGLDKRDLSSAYCAALQAGLECGIQYELINPKMREFDLEQLAAALKPERDLLFTYIGLQTLYDRYFLHTDGLRIELPQTFFMRIAMGLALQEDDPTARAIEFYELLSSFDYMCSTPTLFNAGTQHSQLSSCFLSTIPDDLHGIYDGIKDNALLSKHAGGLGNDWTPVRAMNAPIKSTNGKSSGVVPFLKVANDTAVAVNQGGKRQGALCAYLETWHLDIEEFLELRKNTGDERRRTHDMNTANWIPDLFMKRVAENKEWTLFSPNDVPDLHDFYGQDFEKAYEAYEARARKGELKNVKTISAVILWRKILSMLFETGHPWVTFKDPCNLRSPQQHVGVVHSSNLCTEITLNTSDKEIAVCNLGSVNLAQHVTSTGLDTDKLQRTIKTAIRMLDNVIDINFYAVPQAEYSNQQHRPIGLGMMGFQDALYKLGYSYASEEAVDFADISTEHISYYAIRASHELAVQRGAYASFKGSLWSQGILPIDSIELLKKHRQGYLEQDQKQTLDWAALRAQVKTGGIRNSNVLAIAPTATIANICGITASIEPTYQNLYVKSNLSGEFTLVNTYLVRELKELALWDKAMVNDLKYYDGSIQKIDRIPQVIKEKYLTAFEVEPKWLIQAASRRQKWLDQSQSLNLYIYKPSGKVIDAVYRLAWKLGLKTTYYCKTLGASSTEKATLNRSQLNAVQQCAIDDPDCEACQ